MYLRVPQRWTWRELALLKEALDQGLVEDSEEEVEVEEETSEVEEGSVSSEGESDLEIDTEDEEQEAWWAEEQEIFAQEQ